MKYRNDHLPNVTDAPVDSRRRRLLLAMAAATGTAALGAGVWTHGDRADDVKRVRIVIFVNSGRRLGERMLPKVVKTEAEWKRLLVVRTPF